MWGGGGEEEEKVEGGEGGGEEEKVGVQADTSQLRDIPWRR